VLEKSNENITLNHNARSLLEPEPTSFELLVFELPTHTLSGNTSIRIIDQ
jgi:hypothetical protein